MATSLANNIDMRKLHRKRSHERRGGRVLQNPVDMHGAFTVLPDMAYSEPVELKLGSQGLP